MTRRGQLPSIESGEIPLIFPWRRRHRRILPMILPVFVALIAFAAFLGLLQIRVGTPQFEMERQASLIYLPPTGDGLAWAIRATESGPRLARFEPPSWSGYAAMNAQVLDATRLSAAAHQPVLRSLPDPDPIPTIPLASAGRLYLPKPAPAPAAAVSTAPPALVPALYPLGVAAKPPPPSGLPALPPNLDPAIIAANWRSLVFLVQLHPDGSVASAVALNRIAGPGPGQLEQWLRGVRFDPTTAANGDWLAVGIRFINPSADGADHH